MSNLLPEKYKGWTIEIANDVNSCSNFSFSIISPEGVRQNVKMGGHNAADARLRAKEMIDLELAFAEDE